MSDIVISNDTNFSQQNTSKSPQSKKNNSKENPKQKTRKARNPKRTKAEIDKEKEEKIKRKEERKVKQMEKERQKEEIARQKLEKEMKLKEVSFPLVPGNGEDALAAMAIISAASSIKGHHLTNIEFRRMFASRIIFPPKKNANKFITGGIAEECLHQLILSLGFHSNNVSDEKTVIDLSIEVPIHTPTIDKTHQFNVSVKNIADINNPPTLENYRGKKRDDIRKLPPSFLVYTEIKKMRGRMVYIDHEILKQGYPQLTDEQLMDEVYKNDDSNLKFKSGFLSKFIPRLPKEYILDAEYPQLPSTLSEQNISKLALSVADRQLA